MSPNSSIRMASIALMRLLHKQFGDIASKLMTKEKRKEENSFLIEKPPSNAKGNRRRWGRPPRFHLWAGAHGSPLAW